MSDSEQPTVTIKATQLNFGRQVEYLAEGDNWLQWISHDEVSRCYPQALQELAQRMNEVDDNQPVNQPAVYIP